MEILNKLPNSFVWSGAFVVIAVIGISFFGTFDFNQQENSLENRESKSFVETKVEPIVVSISPTISEVPVQQVVSEPVSSKVLKVSPEIEDSSFGIKEFISQQAFAISPVQLEVTVDIWSLTPGNEPHGVAVDGSDNLWFTERETDKIARLDPSTNTITEWTLAADSDPRGITLDDSGNVWFTEDETNNIGRLDPSANIITEWTMPTSFTTEDPQIDGSGNLWFAMGGDTLARLDPSTNMVTGWEDPAVDGDYDGIAIDESGNVWHTNDDKNRIERLDPTTDTYTRWGTPDGDDPWGIRLDSSGNVFFTEPGNDLIGRLDPSSDIITTWNIPNEDSRPFGIAIDDNDTVYWASQPIGRLVPSTNIISEWTVPSTFVNQLITVDGSGNLWFSSDSEDIVGRMR